jgi:nicotinate-nucleotide adenylyltransferase
MGGTFDPIHAGHLIVANEALHALNLTEVLFVPAARPWQKEPQVDAEHRLAMVQAAIAGEPRFSASTVDIDREGNTYTVDTLADLKRLNPDADLFLLVGSDALESIHTWKEHERIYSLAHVVGLSRAGHLPRADSAPAGAVTLLTVPAIEISSTECRDRLRYGRPVRFMLTSPVYEYITTHELYRRDA